MEFAGRHYLAILLFLLGAGLLLLYATGVEQPEIIASPSARSEVSLRGLPTSNGTAQATDTSPAGARPIPSKQSEPGAMASSTATLAPGPTATAASTFTFIDSNTIGRFPLQYQQRFGVTAGSGDVPAALELGLGFGSYANWNVSSSPPRPDQVLHWQTIRLQDDAVRTPRQDIDAALRARPGAIWLIGNEPDVVAQDNVRPERYAELYHELYTYIKERDPGALVAIAGVSQPTPLRRAYLDIVLDAYQEKYGQPVPVDIWNVHAFILREEHDSWGIGIPPGMSDDLAIKYEIEDHINMEIFRQNITEFRDWMAQRGYGNHPLVVSEYGFLMPEDYGFTSDEVIDFMTATFDFFRSARNETGYAADGGRLVQWWFWFILSGPADDEYAPSFLYDRNAGALTPLGRAYADYVDHNAP